MTRLTRGERPTWTLNRLTSGLRHLIALASIPGTTEGDCIVTYRLCESAVDRLLRRRHDHDPGTDLAALRGDLHRGRLQSPSRTHARPLGPVIDPQVQASALAWASPLGRRRPTLKPQQILHLLRFEPWSSGDPDGTRSPKHSLALIPDPTATVRVAGPSPVAHNERRSYDVRRTFSGWRTCWDGSRTHRAR